nr:motility modulating peptide [Lymnaea stagnalis]
GFRANSASRVAHGY